MGFSLRNVIDNAGSCGMYFSVNRDHAVRFHGLGLQVLIIVVIEYSIDYSKSEVSVLCNRNNRPGGTRVDVYIG